MDMSGAAFPDNVSRALADGKLQYAMTETGPRFIQKRAKAREALPEFDQLRDQARDIKDHVLANLDVYLERYEARVRASGGQVHWAETPDQARAAILGICRKVNAEMRELLKKACLRVAEVEIEDPRLVGVDPLGFDVRGRFDIVRLDADPEIADESDAYAALEDLAAGSETA